MRLCRAGAVSRRSMYREGRCTRYAKCVTFQMAEAAVPRELFVAMLERIPRFGVPPPLVQRE